MHNKIEELNYYIVYYDIGPHWSSCKISIGLSDIQSETNIQYIFHEPINLQDII